jgi:hypothetical protein
MSIWVSFCNFHWYLYSQDMDAITNVWAQRLANIFLLVLLDFLKNQRKKNECQGTLRSVQRWVHSLSLHFANSTPYCKHQDVSPVNFSCCNSSSCCTCALLECKGVPFPWLSQIFIDVEPSWSPEVDKKGQNKNCRSFDVIWPHGLGLPSPLLLTKHLCKNRKYHLIGGGKVVSVGGLPSSIHALSWRNTSLCNGSKSTCRLLKTEKALARTDS